MRALGRGVGPSVPSGKVAWAPVLEILFTTLFYFYTFVSEMLQRLVGGLGSEFPRESRAPLGGVEGAWCGVGVAGRGRLGSGWIGA